MEMVDHPSHYSRNGKEAIDYIEKWRLNFATGNTVKYLWRLGQKGPSQAEQEEDVEKSVWYVHRQIEWLSRARKCLLMTAMVETAGQVFGCLQDGDVLKGIPEWAKRKLFEAFRVYCFESQWDCLKECMRTGKWPEGEECQPREN